MKNLVKVKNAFGDTRHLRHYGTLLIERVNGNFIIKPYYSASSVRAINQWFEAVGFDLKLSRKQGDYKLIGSADGFKVVETGEGYKLEYVRN